MYNNYQIKMTYAYATCNTSLLQSTITRNHNKYFTLEFVRLVSYTIFHFKKYTSQK